MKKIIVMMLVALVCLAFIACDSNEPVETEPVENEPVETVDPIEKAKEKLTEAYDTCCGGNDKEYASLGYDKMSLTIDTKPNDMDYSGEDDAFAAIFDINTFLGLPSSLAEKMSSTRAIDGMQSQNCGTYTATWTYYPDDGMKVIYEVNP